jgi:CubicO group peptidase (beta-lactamase class C family)
VYRYALVLLLLLAGPASAEPRVSLSEIRDPTVVGIDAAGLRRIDAIIEAAIAAKVTPGAALAIGRHGQVVRLRGYGRLEYKPGAPRVTERTIYDLASLTKPVATTTAVMLLVQEGLLDLDAPLAMYFAEWRGQDDRARITARHLLNHTSGLPAGGILSGVGSDRARIVSHMATVPLRNRPGAVWQYSDYGMILLGALVERISGERLDEFLDARVFEPLGLDDTGFNPLRWNASSALRFASVTTPVLARIAPTERTSHRGLIHGVVHDPLALRLGGVAGHAGLFGSARDLAAYAGMLLSNGKAGDLELLQPDLLRTFLAPASERSRFTLGWEVARPENSSAGAFAASAYGHTGFTGTSMWIDPERDLFVVLLTNRLNPNSREQRHLKLRRDVHSALARAVRS